MSFKASIAFKYDSEWTYGSSEFLPEEHITMEFPAQDVNTEQLFSAFNKFLLAIGYNDEVIANGATSLAFNPDLPIEKMRKTAYKYDLILSEDHHQKIQELETEIENLKAKLSRLKDPENPNYTEEEMNAMSSQAEKKITKKILQNAYKVCNNCGNNYGTYKGGVSSWWVDNCDVCGAIDLPVTEARDFRYLEKGIQRFSK